MSDESRNRWDLLALCMWALFFGIALVPVLVFHALRNFADVMTQTAFVNTSAAITVSFTAYIALFAFRQCRASGLNESDARSRALVVTILGIAAFLEIPAKGSSLEVLTLLDIMVHYRDLPDAYLRLVIVLIGGSKIMSWCYLFSLVLRYHAFGNREVFAQLSPLFPSLRRSRKSAKAPTDAVPRLERP